MADFFTRNIILVYFFYGLSFFVMGLAILLESGHSSKLDFARALRPLIWFGLIHGCHEWFEMFLIIRNSNHRITCSILGFTRSLDCSGSLISISDRFWSPPDYGRRKTNAVYRHVIRHLCYLGDWLTWRSLQSIHQPQPVPLLRMFIPAMH